jgi:hypothetical protein
MNAHGSLEPRTGAQIGEIRISKLMANIAAIPLFVLTFAPALALYDLLPHAVDPGRWELWIFLGAMFCMVVLHEYCHAYAAIRFGQVPKNVVEFGINPRGLMPYCHFDWPVRNRVYRLVALFPFYLLGSVVLIALLVYPTLWLTFLLGLTVAACLGDFWMVILLRNYDRGAYVRDAKGEPGCDIFEAACAGRVGGVCSL